MREWPDVDVDCDWWLELLLQWQGGLVEERVAWSNCDPLPLQLHWPPYPLGLQQYWEHGSPQRTPAEAEEPVEGELPGWLAKTG